MSDSQNPFSPKVLIGGLLVTVIGGVIVAIIVGEGRFAPGNSSSSVTTVIPPTIVLKVPSSTSQELPEVTPPGQVTSTSDCSKSAIIVSPKDKGLLLTLIPEILWKPTTPRSSIELSRDPNFKAFDLKSKVSAGVIPELLRERFPQNLMPSTVYYLRVISRCDLNSYETEGASAVISFKTCSGGNILPAPLPIEPGDGNLASGVVRHKWLAVSGAKGYVFRHNNGQSFANGTDLEYEAHYNSDAGVQTWSVAAFNDYAIGEVSKVMSYTVISKP